jgi:hypothetical protein
VKFRPVKVEKKNENAQTLFFFLRFTVNTSLSLTLTPHTRLSSPSVALDFEFPNDMRLVVVCVDREGRSTALPSHHHFRYSTHIDNTSGHHINTMPSRQNLCSSRFFFWACGGVGCVDNYWVVQKVVDSLKRFILGEVARVKLLQHTVNIE